MTIVNSINNTTATLVVTSETPDGSSIFGGSSNSVSQAIVLTANDSLTGVNGDRVFLEANKHNTSNFIELNYNAGGSVITIANATSGNDQIIFHNNLSNVMTIGDGAGNPAGVSFLGIVTAGTWQGNPITGTYGGTGVNNGFSTITIGGNVAFSGASTFTGTLTGNTSVTFPTSGTLATTGATVTSVSGTANRITSTGGTTPVIDISAAYVGQNSITTLGTITSGTWQGAVVGGTYGGTGINNGASTITIGGNVTFSGAHTFSGTLTGNTAVTFPTSGTLSTTTGTVTSITAGTNLTGGTITTTGTIALSATPSGLTSLGTTDLTATGLTTLAALTQAGTANINATGSSLTSIGNGSASVNLNGNTNILGIYQGGIATAGTTFVCKTYSAHDNMQMLFDIVDGSNITATSSNGCFRITKQPNALWFQYGNATAGNPVTLTTGLLLGDTGILTSRNNTLDNAGNMIVAGTLNVTSTTLLSALTQAGTANINNSGSATTNIAASGTGNTNIGNSTGALTQLGAPIGINDAGAGTTNIAFTSGTGNVNIGNTTGNLTQLGSNININCLSPGGTDINSNANAGNLLLGNINANAFIVGNSIALRTSGAGVTIDHTVTNYNGVATAGMGFFPVIASAYSAGLSSANTFLSFLTPATETEYQVVVALDITGTGAFTSIQFRINYFTLLGVSSSVLIPYFDGSNIQTSVVNAGSTNAYIPVTVRCFPSTTFQVQTIGIFNTVAYTASVRVLQIAASGA